MNSPHQDGSIPTSLTKNYDWAHDAYFPQSPVKEPYGPHVFVIFPTKEMDIQATLRTGTAVETYFAGRDMQEYHTYKDIRYQDSLMIRNKEEYDRLVAQNVKTREEALRVLGRTNEGQQTIEDEAAREDGYERNQSLSGYRA